MYPYNKSSVEGRRLFKLLGSKYNQGQISPSDDLEMFQERQVNSVMQCRANKTSFLMASNLSNIQRPQIHVHADIEHAWGEFSDSAKALDFTHGQELPMTYVQPLDDETLKVLIDAGFYEDERFEELMSKLIADDVFDVDGNISVALLDVYNQEGGRAPVMIADSVHVVHNDLESVPENTNVTQLVQRAARLAIELRNSNVKTDELIKAASQENSVDSQVILHENIDDFKEVSPEILVDSSQELSVTSELLDKEIDVTNDMEGTVLFGSLSEDEKIKDLKERQLVNEGEEYESDVVDELSQLLDPTHSTIEQDGELDFEPDNDLER